MSRKDKDKTKKPYKVGVTEKVIAWFLRQVAFVTGASFDEPGPHVCFRCSLYDPNESVCRIAVFRPNSPVDETSGKHHPELRRVFPFDPCIRQHDKETGNLNILDLEEMRREVAMAKKLSEEEKQKQRSMLRSIGKMKLERFVEQDDTLQDGEEEIENGWKHGGDNRV